MQNYEQESIYSKLLSSKWNSVILSSIASVALTYTVSSPFLAELRFDEDDAQAELEEQGYEDVQLLEKNRIFWIFDRGECDKSDDVSYTFKVQDDQAVTVCKSLTQAPNIAESISDVITDVVPDISNS